MDCPTTGAAGWIRVAIDRFIEPDNYHAQAVTVQATDGATGDVLWQSSRDFAVGNHSFLGFYGGEGQCVLGPNTQETRATAAEYQAAAHKKGFHVRFSLV